MSHPDVEVRAEGDACDRIELACAEGMEPYVDRCGCGCIRAAGAAFACADDDDCVPEGCCRPTGCVARDAGGVPRCHHDEVNLCCQCEDCRASVSGCACVDGLCRTTWDPGVCG